MALQLLSPFYVLKCKGSLLLANLQCVTDYSPGECMHPAPPPPTLTYSSIPFIYDVLPRVCLYQQFVFNVIDSVALNPELKAVSHIICETSLTTT